MIGKIAGRLDYRSTDHVLIDTGGVGYIVYCSERTLAAMPAPGEAVALFTKAVSRGEKTLYGKKTTGVIRSTVLIGPDGKVQKHWKRVASAAEHPAKVLATVQGDA